MKALADYCERPVIGTAIFLSFCSVLYGWLMWAEGQSQGVAVVGGEHGE